MNITTVLSDEAIKFLRENCRTMTIKDLCDNLGVGKYVVSRYIRELGLEKRNEKVRLGVMVDHNQKEQEASKFQVKLKAVKKKVKVGMEIGPYLVIRPYTNHCLVMNKFGYKESLTYMDLARYFKVEE